jgi:tetratricopeptide (TPR) repeat protein
VPLIDVQSLKCPACSAPYSPGQKVCGFCNTPLPQSPDATPVAEGSASDGTEELVDYYALIGLTPAEAPTLIEIERAALQAQQRHLLNQFLSQEERQKLTDQIEIARWILTDDQSRREYDGLLLMLRNGIFNDKHLGTLGELQQRAQRELGLSDEQTTPQELLQQGIGYQTLGMHQEAVAVLKRAVEAMPDSAETNYRYARALLSAENPLSMGGHHLRQAATSFKAAAILDASLLNAAAYEKLCRGLLARSEGNLEQAQQDLQHATRMDATLGIGWLALASLALRQHNHKAVLGYCLRALQCNAQDEQAYLMLVASCWRAGEHDRAYDAASRVAKLRGSDWDAPRVLQEIVG